MKFIAIALAALSLFFASSPLQADHKTLNIAQGYIAADILPLWIAIDRNLFEKHALETAVTHGPGRQKILSALLSRPSDIAGHPPSSFLLSNLPLPPFSLF